MLVGFSDKTNTLTVDGCLLNQIALARLFETKPPIGDAPIPATDWRGDVRLYPYQTRDIQSTLHLPHVLNANPMGYGKTVEALQWCRARGYKKILVLCPKSTRYQWQTAVWEWFDVEAEICLTPKTVAELVGADVVITNYEQLIVAGAPYKLWRGEWDCIIADEVHRVRNHKSKTSCALRLLKTKGRIGLTGTPIMNQPDDLWGIGLWLNAHYLGTSYWNFVNLYCQIDESYWGRKIVGATENAALKSVLKATLDRFWIRNPNNLFGKGTRIRNVPLEMYPAQATLYKQVKQLAIEALEKVGIMIPNAMTQLMDMQRLTTNPESFEAYTGKNIKFEWIQDLLSDNPEVKICVFSKFKRAIQALNKLLGDKACVSIHGDVSANKREEAKQNFISNPGIRVITGTIGAMSEGIDGLQAVCNTVIFLDRAWNPEENNQAIARVARMGQDKVVNVYMLDCIGTIDEHVDKINHMKLTDIKELIYRDCATL
jgi:non-specific serine/threonine protein kinase